MAGRGRTTSQKRQREQARLERRQQKEAKREARKTGDKQESDDDQYLRDLLDMEHVGAHQE